MNQELRERIKQASRAPVLLVASDYDGTISPIVANPEDARPIRESIVALQALAQMSQTHVAVISGRSLRQLASMTGLPESVHLVGSHGSEFDPDFASKLTPEQNRLRERLIDELQTLAGEYAGCSVEEKPASVAFHYRNASDAERPNALDAVERGPMTHEGVTVKRGKMVIELCVTPVSKADALERIRHRVGAAVAIFVGDDVTDEDAFEVLAGPDLAIKVGEGETRASLRVADPHEVSQMLAELAELREEWARGCDATPIERHAYLSDMRTGALVTPEGRVSWMCAPRVDSPALFAHLLGGETAGHFTVRPAHPEARPLEQRYVGDSLVLETLWRDLRVVDYLDASSGRTSQRAGRVDLLRVIEGAGAIEITFAPRLDFGRVGTTLKEVKDGLEVDDTHDPITLLSRGVSWTITREGQHDTARALVEVSPDSPVVLELRYGAGGGASTHAEAERREQTRRVWTSWASRLTLPEVEPEHVRRSALTLKSLCYGPTGAILAAGTTSLPEHIGGVRNWDYRYCWLRDGAMAAAALVKVGSSSEAMRFLDWVLDVVDRTDSPERLHPLYTVSGGELGAEATIPELSGYRGSRPVRVGNAASRQVQLDVFGPIVDLVWLLHESGAPISGEHWRLVEAMVTAVERRWREPDHGIWEVRGPRRHHTHSKLECWVAADRGVRLAQRFLGRTRDDWIALRDGIAEELLARAWNEELGAYGAAYDLGEADAAVLPMALCGLVGPEDKRFVRTVEVIEKKLRLGPAVYRYRYDDGLPGPEGAFHLCTSWLIRAYLVVGRRADAESLFTDMLALMGPTGLLPEQYGPKTRRALGNHPQAFSHLGLIEAAIALARAD